MSLGVLIAVAASSVSLLGAVVAYEPLVLAAVFGRGKTPAAWWPLLVYGPYAVGALSVVRASLHRRRAFHSWAVVLLFSTLAMLLCVVQTPHSIGAMAVAALPGLASLVCFQQAARQITLTRPPRRAFPRRRHGTSPHTAHTAGALNGSAHPLRADAIPSPPAATVQR
ncbi:hypothetical protein ACIQU3_06715 [Streptomyces sp. NPDC101110]|uniref:hypothetical protein n=1 Tax=unclassified Streptomyces TaxID=2593676 RepID=UPI0038254D6E